MKIEFTLNGKPVSIEANGDRKLLWLLRSDLELTGAKYGCGSSACGACTVLMNGKAVRSCNVPVRTIQGASITTIEGLATAAGLHPLQQAFVDEGALQCGFCTPGMILNAYALLQATPRPTRAEIITGMDRNLCRCGAHRRILRAIEKVVSQPGGAQ